MPQKEAPPNKSKLPINKASDVIGRSFTIHSANMAESQHGENEHFYYVTVIFEDNGSLEKIIMGGYAVVEKLDRYIATYARERTSLTIIEKKTPQDKIMHQLWITELLDNN